MSNHKTQALQQSLSAVYKLVQANEPDQALVKLKPWLRKLPQNADVNHLAALAYKSLEDQQKSLEYFLRSLALNAQQPQVHNNLANLYKSLANYVAAEQHYTKALSQQPSYLEAARNLALCYAAQDKYDQAIKAFDTALRLKPEDLVSLTGLADCHRSLGNFDQAQKLYQDALRIDPNYFNAWYKQGQNQHLNGDLAGAISCYQKAYALDSSQTSVVFALGSALHEAGVTEQAIEIFEIALQTRMGDVLLHERLNQILWESDQSANFGHSYQSAILQLPNSLELRLSYLAQLISAGNTARAWSEMNKALEQFGEGSEILSLKASMHADELEFEIAAAHYRKALALGFRKDTAQGLVKVLIILTQYLEAQTLLDELIANDQSCQLSWGLQSLVWRLTGDKKYHWLNNYERYVQAFELTAPPGYASIDEFLDKLKSSLLALHKTQNQPLEQTLKNGTQTAARLFNRPEPEIQSLKQMLHDIAMQYIRDLPDDDLHPLLSRKSEQIEFSGSWSVKLRPNGFHVNHVHPAGWISSSCYIAIPNSMLQADEDMQGCIKFGESPLALGELEVIEKVVRPQAGMVVLFPSYMWHGTFPFPGEVDEFRLTSPFDIAPL